MSTSKLVAEPGSHELSVTREVAAAPPLVYRAFTDPGLLAQWLGPRRLAMKVVEHDLRHGGAYRYIHVDTDGAEYAFRGVFHGEPSVTAGIVQTWEFEGAPGHISLEKATFTPCDAGTLITLSSIHQSVEARDAHLASGMEAGMIESFERLDELVERTRS